MKTEESGNEVAEEFSVRRWTQSTSAGFGDQGKRLLAKQGWGPLGADNHHQLSAGKEIGLQIYNSMELDSGSKLNEQETESSSEASRKNRALLTL